MFRDFSKFEIEDFAFDESFQKWVTDQDSDHSDFWEGYMNEYPHQIDKILSARELVLKLTVGESAVDRQAMAAAIWNNVRQRVYVKRSNVFQTGRWFRVAAAVSLLMVSTFLLYRFNTSVRQPSAHKTGANLAGESVITYMNKEDKVMRVVLKDGSVVNLEKNSRLVWSNGFQGRERVVYLYGEAFFDIKKNPKQPFIIFANKTVVKVLGTSFRVKAYDHSPKVVVSVKSGKVSVFERKDFEKAVDNAPMSGLVLMANQQAEFSNDLKKFSKVLVPEPLLLGTANKKEFDFDQTPLSQVFETLEKAYGIEIICDKDLIAGRLLKIGLEDESLFEKLDLICKTMGLTYHIVDARIIIETNH